MPESSSIPSGYEGQFEIMPRQEPPPEPQYLPLQEASFRNLFLGFFCLIVAVILFVGAWFLMGPQSIIPLATAVLVLFLLASLWAFGVHRQRGGLFLSFGVVTIIGALVPLLTGVILRLQKIELGSITQEVAPNAPGTPTVITNSAAPAFPEVRVSNEPPLLSEVFGVVPPANGHGDQVRILNDSRVELEGRIYLMKAGQIFPIHSKSAEGVVIRAKDYLITLSGGMVETVKAPMVSVASVNETRIPSTQEPAVEPKVPDKAEITRKAQAEAIQKFPALQIPGSEENELFVEMYADIKANRPQFLEDPAWPLKLAEQLAATHRWVDATKPYMGGPLNFEQAGGGLDETMLNTDDAASTTSDTLYLNESPGAGPALPQPQAPNPVKAGNIPTEEDNLDAVPPLEIKTGP